MTQELSTTSILALFETNKEQRATFVEHTLQAIDEGQASPLTLQLQMKCMEDVIKSVSTNERYSAALLEEAQKNGKQFDYHNAKFQVKEAGTKYDYSNCGDPILSELEAESEKASTKLKDRQKFLQNAPTEGVDIITNDGEVTKVFPPSKSSTTTIAVTLK